MRWEKQNATVDVFDSACSCDSEASSARELSIQFGELLLAAALAVEVEEVLATTAELSDSLSELPVLEDTASVLGRLSCSLSLVYWSREGGYAVAAVHVHSFSPLDSKLQNKLQIDYG